MNKFSSITPIYRKEFMCHHQHDTDVFISSRFGPLLNVFVARHTKTANTLANLYLDPFQFKRAFLKLSWRRLYSSYRGQSSVSHQRCSSELVVVVVVVTVVLCELPITSKTGDRELRLCLDAHRRPFSLLVTVVQAQRERIAKTK